MEPSNNKVPNHIAFIMDGNRRFAKQLMLKPWKGHEWGAKKLEQVLDWCAEYKIKELTLYAFSMQNFNRPKDEFNYLMGIFRREFENLKNDSRLEKNSIKIRFIGRIHLFPKGIYEKMKEIMEKTKNNSSFIVNFAMAYGGKEEIIDAVKKMSLQLKNGDVDIDSINEENFSKNLYMEDKPDLIVRTGGERRTSNFLMWQSDYSEWVFLEKKWPELEKEDFVNILEDYSKRERRFGK